GQYRETDSVADNCQWFLNMLVTHEVGVPFAAVYWVEAEQQRARLLCSAGGGSGSEVLPTTIDIEPDSAGQHFLDALRRRQLTVVPTVEQLGIQLREPYPEQIQSCTLYPVTKRGQDFLPAVLLMAVGTQVTLDDDALGYLHLLGTAFRQLITGAYTRSRWEEANAALIASERQSRVILEGQFEMVCCFLLDGTIP